ncbi:hypothetical protein PILCRDRAFT_818598 [Piloderma croceum F 1598]|uniref:Uncharacterized protein n=1 Tax=Piloderma croceum (strain F 1598) TaxID=765440 RepID=A0A0C3G0Q6_PILCF|nr:hypothetical protein PILCRDRAFT_818598 [Piloderma croceum F 1598]
MDHLLRYLHHITCLHTQASKEVAFVGIERLVDIFWAFSLKPESTEADLCPCPQPEVINLDVLYVPRAI